MTCIFGDAAMFIRNCRVLFGDIFIVPFLGSALGFTEDFFFVKHANCSAILSFSNETTQPHSQGL